MAPCTSKTFARLAVMSTALLSRALQSAAGPTTSTVATARETPPQRQPRGTATTAAAAAVAHPSNSALAWVRWDQASRQDPNRIEGGTAGSLQLDGRNSRSAAAVSQEPVQDSSWTPAAFRAFHEMRAGSPSTVSVGMDCEKQGEDGQDAGEVLVVEARRLATKQPGRELNVKKDGPAKDAGEGGEDNRERDEQGNAVCWHMKGRLTNAATGQTIALVEGVELARSLAFEVAPSRGDVAATARRRNMVRGSKGALGGGELVPTTTAVATATAAGEDGELEVDKVLQRGLWKAFGSLACSKFFMYQDPATGEPMDHFRNTPVEKKQAVRTYERFSQVVSHLLQPNGRVLVVSEWGGRSVKAETANNNGVEEVEGDGRFFSGGGGNRLGTGKAHRSFDPSHSPRRVFNLHFFVEARTPKEERELKRWQERPGARWIAFGSPPPRAHGCKEVYSYITGRGGGGREGNGEVAGGRKGGWQRSLKLPWFSKGESTEEPRRGLAASGHKRKSLSLTSSSSKGGRGGGGGGGGSGGLMSYTRYGECPTWYGTGRMCGLDVQARRVDSFASLPAKLREKVLELDPKFEAGPPGTMAEARRNAREKRLEREEERQLKRRWLPGLFRP